MKIGQARGPASAVGAGGLFVLLWLVLGVPLPFSLVAGAAGFGALWYMLKGRRVEPDESPRLEEFVDLDMARKTAAQGRELAASLQEQIARLPRGDRMGARLSRLVELLVAIVKDIESDPKDATAARAFLGFQGESALRIARLALDMQARGASEAQLRDARAKIESSLDRLIRAHELHLARLQEDNIAELQGELEALEESLAIEDGSGTSR